MKIVVPFAEGFEEIEAITIVDILRRAFFDVTTVFLTKNPVTGSHNIQIIADQSIDKINYNDYDAIILPGGMPGSENLKNSNKILELTQKIYDKKGFIGAICAAPIVLGRLNLLKNKEATCYPGFEDQLNCDKHRDLPVVQDGNILTGRGPGCAIPFVLKILENFADKKTADEMKKGLQVYWE